MASLDLRQMGVVGAGGAGFPTAVKAHSQVEYVLANGAECEPLVHKDVHVMERFAPQVVGGLRIMMACTGATKGRICIKAKHAAAIKALEQQLGGTGIDINILGDFYPAGDEYEIVHSATGRLIPPAGLPAQVGCVVNNTETLYNVFYAAQGQPVTHKFVSVVGLVGTPSCFHVPIGTMLSEVLRWAGGKTDPEAAVYLNGLMMGRLIDNLDIPVTKTTGAMIVLPGNHRLVQRARISDAERIRVNRAACDQCSHCTELCPRHLLGYQVNPHKVMRGLGFSAPQAELLNQNAALCVQCGLCTMYSCPEGLFPREACIKAKGDLRAAGIKFVQQTPPEVHPMMEGRRVSTLALRKRLGVLAYDTETEYRELPEQPRKVRILFSQHIGKPAMPVVSVGTPVTVGQVVASVPEDQLGVNIHASINGVVSAVTDTYLEIEG